MADKTTGELDSVKVEELPAAPDIYDDFKMPGELQGEAVHVTGSQIKDYAVAAGVKASEVFAESVKADANAAATAKENAEASAKAADNEATAAAASAGKAASSSTLAQNALTGVQNAIENIPSGSTLIVNDLTTGGTKAALSAEMGKVLNEKFKGYVYTSLSEIGLSDADLSATDFKANIAAILAALPNTPIIFSPSSTTNFTASLRAKINDDLSLSIQTAQPRMWFTRFGGTNVPAKIDVVIDSTTYTQIFTARVDSTSEGATELQPFIVTYDSSGFLKQSGGTLTGDLEIAKDVPRMILAGTNGEVRVSRVASYGVVQCKNTENDTVARQLRMYPFADDATKKNAMMFATNESGSYIQYYLLGTHNKPSGSYAGTGAADTQTIDVGAIGNAIMVWNNTGDRLSIVTPRGAICKNGTTLSALSADECSYTDGVLTLATVSDFLNRSGYTYSYRAL